MSRSAAARWLTLVVAVSVVVAACSTATKAPPPRDAYGNGIKRADKDAESPPDPALDELPRPVAVVEPLYPPDALKSGADGRVVLRILIDRAGEVRAVKVIRCDAPGLGFEESAVAAVKKWRFTPPTVKGAPVDAWVDLPIRFTKD